MRVVASALAVLAVSSGPPGVGPATGKLAYRDGNRVVIAYLDSALRQPVAAPDDGAPRWSGDGRLLSIGGTVLGRVALPTTSVAWAPTGETAAYQTRTGALLTWSPGGARVVVPASWGAVSFAWGPGGRLALGRSICHAPCGIPAHQEVWVWRAGGLHRVAGPLPGVQRPIVRGFDSTGRVLWWPDPQGSGSIMADGLQLYANRVALFETLVYPDYVTPCGSRVAMAVGGDRYAMHGKRIMLDGRNLSDDPSRSWVSPACSDDGSVVVAAASRNTVPNRIGREHRSIWQLLPSRRRLTLPPTGWTDEYPRVLRDGAIFFVRTRATSRKVGGAWRTTQAGRMMILSHDRLTQVGVSTITQDDTSERFPSNFYGHYPWPDLLSIAS